MVAPPPNRCDQGFHWDLIFAPCCEQGAKPALKVYPFAVLEPAALGEHLKAKKKGMPSVAGRGCAPGWIVSRKRMRCSSNTCFHCHNISLLSPNSNRIIGIAHITGTEKLALDEVVQRVEIDIGPE